MNKFYKIFSSRESRNFVETKTSFQTPNYDKTSTVGPWRLFYICSSDKASTVGIQATPLLQFCDKTSTVGPWRLFYISSSDKASTVGIQTTLLR